MEKFSSFGLLYWLIWVHTRDRLLRYIICWEPALKAVSKRACGNAHGYFCIFKKLILQGEKTTPLCLTKVSSGLRLFIGSVSFLFHFLVTANNTWLFPSPSPLHAVLHHLFLLIMSTVKPVFLIYSDILFSEGSKIWLNMITWAPLHCLPLQRLQIGCLATFFLPVVHYPLWFQQLFPRRQFHDPKTVRKSSGTASNATATEVPKGKTF